MTRAGLPIVLHGQKDAWYKKILSGDFTLPDWYVKKPSKVGVKAIDDLDIGMDVEMDSGGAPPLPPPEMSPDDVGGDLDFLDGNDSDDSGGIERALEAVIDEMERDGHPVMHPADDANGMPDDGRGGIPTPPAGAGGIETPDAMVAPQTPRTPPMAAAPAPSPPPPPLPLPDRDVLVEETLASGSWGVFRLTARPAGKKGGKHGGLRGPLLLPQEE